ncbi:MAG: hypothetical protein AAFU65_07725 [Pseudomonadota bacterium]
MTYFRLFVVACALAAAGCSGGSGDDAAKVNLAPTLSAISPTQLEANLGDQPVTLVIDDEAPSVVEITVGSSRTDVIRSTDLVVTGRGRQRTLLISPVADVTGDAQITVTARDPEGLATRMTFDVRVAAQQRSMQTFARATFDRTDADAPVLINAVEFIADAEADDFADLLTR